MITAKQRRNLKNMSNGLKPIFQLGKEGISHNFIKGINEVLETHELIKISVLANNKEDLQNQANKIVEETNAHLIQIIGKKIVIYRPSKNKLIDINKE